MSVPIQGNKVKPKLPEEMANQTTKGKISEVLSYSCHATFEMDKEMKLFTNTEYTHKIKLKENKDFDSDFAPKPYLLSKWL